MLFIVIFILILILGSALLGEKKYFNYDEYCNLECWSRRNPAAKHHN